MPSLAYAHPVVDEDNMSPEPNYREYAERIKKPRSVILTRLEFQILVVLYEGNRAMAYSEISQGILSMADSSMSVNISKQLKGLMELDVIDQPDGKEYVLTTNGYEAVQLAGQLVNLLFKL